MHLRPLCWLFPLSVALCACGGPADDTPPPPDPGTLRVVSETPLSLAWHRPNLLPNDYFREWEIGESAPKGYQAPDREYSEVAMTSGGGVRQTWQRSDRIDDANLQFRARAALRQGVRYRLMVLAESVAEPGVISLAVWNARNQDDPALLIPNLLNLLPGEGLLKTYAATFTVPEAGMYLLSAQAVLEPDTEARVIWHRWHLIEMQEEDAA